MKIYLVIHTTYYESNDVVKAFLDKDKAIEFIKKEAEEINTRKGSNSKYKYIMKENGLSWGSTLGCLEIQEIEVE